MNFLKPTSIRRISALNCFRSTTTVQILHPPARSGSFSPDLLRRQFFTSQSASMASDPDPSPNWTVTVPEKQSYVIERNGKYSQTLYSGSHFLKPMVDRIVDFHSLEEKAIEVNTNRMQISNKSVSFTGFMYVRIVDPYLASYHNKPQFSIPMVTKFAETAFSNRIKEIDFDLVINQIPDPVLSLPAGKIFLEEIFDVLEEEKIMDSINQVAKGWGLMCSGAKFYDMKVSTDDFMKLCIQAEHWVRRRRNLGTLVELQNRANLLSGLIEEEKKKGDCEERRVIIKRAREEIASLLATMESLSEKRSSKD